jgi:hypothetical protein
MALKHLSIGKASQLVKTMLLGEENKSANDTVLSDEGGKKAVKEVFETEIIRDMMNKYEARRTERLPLELVWRLCVNSTTGTNLSVSIQ